jgi:hypothetical protein
VTGSASSTNNLKVLKGKIASLAPYAVDPTLSEEGSAADAKAVGDALEKKVGYTDIVDNLATNDADKPLSAKQGVNLKKQIDNLKAETEETVNNATNAANKAVNDAQKAQNSADSAMETAEIAQTSADEKISPDGSVAMGADLKMGGFKVVNMAEPDADTDGANKAYVDSRHFFKEVSLSSNAWSTTTGSAPYTQTVAVADILATDKPHYTVVYSDNIDTKLAEKESYALVDDLDTDDGTVTFTCFEKKPTVTLNIQLEVNR